MDDLIEGGQGRTATELMQSARVAGTCMALGVLLGAGAVALGVWQGQKEVRVDVRPSTQTHTATTAGPVNVDLQPQIAVHARTVEKIRERVVVPPVNVQTPEIKTPDVTLKIPQPLEARIVEWPKLQVIENINNESVLPQPKP